MDSKTQKIQNSGAFGNDDINGSHPFYDATNEFEKYIQESMSKIDEYVEADATKILVTSNNISISFYGDHTNRQAMSLSKNGSQYELTLKTRFYDGSKYDKVAQNSLKLLLAAFSSQPTKLYDVIYESYEGDNNTGISKTNWITVVDTKVKYDIVNGNAVYYFKAK
jgi:hypothetical protein